MECGKCHERAVYHRRWEGTFFCKAHFIEAFERRFLKEAKGLVQRGDKVAIGLSGGKDSASLLFLLSNVKERLGIEVVALSIDEGIGGYRPETLKAAEGLCHQLGVPHHVVSYKDEVGLALDELPAKLKTEKINWCSWCGVWRRWLLNRGAKRLGATKLAVGHNLDDEAQSVLMNLMRGDWQHLAPMPQPGNTEGGLVTRIKPFRSVPEKETTLYAVLQGLPFSGAECPHSFDMLRRKVGAMINEVEREHPGTKLQILATSDKVKSLLKAPEGKAPTVCKACGEAAAGDVCRACELKADVSA